MEATLAAAAASPTSGRQENQSLSCPGLIDNYEFHYQVHTRIRSVIFLEIQLSVFITSYLVGVQ